MIDLFFIYPLKNMYYLYFMEAIAYNNCIIPEFSF